MDQEQLEDLERDAALALALGWTQVDLRSRTGIPPQPASAEDTWRYRARKLAALVERAEMAVNTAVVLVRRCAEPDPENDKSDPVALAREALTKLQNIETELPLLLAETLLMEKPPARAPLPRFSEREVDALQALEAIKKNEECESWTVFEFKQDGFYGVRLWSEATDRGLIMGDTREANQRARTLAKACDEFFQKAGKP